MEYFGVSLLLLIIIICLCRIGWVLEKIMEALDQLVRK